MSMRGGMNNHPFFYDSNRDRDPESREKMRMTRRRTPALFGSSASSGIESYAPEYPLCTVTCVFEGESWPDFAIYNPEYFAESRFSVWEQMEREDTYYFQVPPGVYDVAGSFYSTREDLMGYAHIIHEDVEVNGDITVRFSPDEATEKFEVRPMMMSGEVMTLPVGVFLEDDPWFILDDSDANTVYFSGDYVLFREGCDVMASGMKAMNFCDAEFPPDFVLITNRLSDKYHFVTHMFIASKDGHYEIVSSDAGDIYTRVVDSYNKGYVRYPVPEFTDTPLFFEEGCEKHRFALSGSFWIDDVQMGGGGLYIENPYPEVYVTSQPSESVDLKTVVRPVSVQMEKTFTFEEDMDGEIVTWSDTFTGEISALPAWYDGTDWQYINQNHSECGNYAFQIPYDGGSIVEYPGVEAYSFIASELREAFGNSTPVCVVMTQVRNWSGSRLISFNPQAWIGRYGEVRNCDFWTASTIVANGEDEILYDSAKDGDLDNWKIDYFTSSHEEGVLNGTFKNSNILIDGQLKGYNLTTVRINETEEDVCAPTPQMLIFKHRSGRITDRFDNASDGVMEFSAGDFNWFEDTDGYGFTVEEAEVKVEYSPYGEDLWYELEVQEIPENFYMPGFGYFYRGYLENVTQPSSNGWYDLRMTLSDKSGNVTTEILSPAFKIGSGAGVNCVVADGVKIWVAEGMLHTAGAAVSSIELYCIDGRCLARTCGSSLDLSTPVQGTVIVRATTEDGRISTRKLLL